MDEKETPTNTEATNEQDELVQQVQAWFQLVRNILSEQYPDYEVEGQVALHPAYGHLFALKLKKEDKFYTCGFLLTEIIRVFQHNGNPPLWLSSFFYDMIQAGENRPLPAPPTSDEEATKILQEKVMPMVMEGVQEEFHEDQQVYIDIDTNEQLGPVLEMGFPTITDGPNTCAIPLQYLMTMYLLNRDPSEHAVQSLTRLLDQNNKEEEANANA